MSFYLDTSVVVASLTNEEATARVTKWLRQNSDTIFAISVWVKTEVSAALSIKVRAGALDERFRASALAEFHQVAQESYEVLPVAHDRFDFAAKLADNYGLGLRAGDALHLAIASAYHMPLCTLDKRLAKAGLELGINTHLL